MTIHFSFFIIDCVSWVALGFLMGLKLYPHKKSCDYYEKYSFMLATTTLSFFSGLWISIARGLPENGFSFYNFFNAAVITFFGIWLFSGAFRNKLYKRVASFYTNTLRPRIKNNYPLIRFS